MRHTLQFLFLSLTLAACNNSATTESTRSDTTQNSSASAESSNNDTLIINTVAAVFTEPDSLQIETRKKAAGEEDFYAGADDYKFYLYSAHEFLDSMKVKTIFAKDKKFIKFISNNNVQQVIRLDTLPELWNIYLFDGKTKPKQIDMSAIDEEYKSYFK